MPAVARGFANSVRGLAYAELRIMTRAVVMLAILGSASLARADCPIAVVVVPDSEDVSDWNPILTVGACLQDDRIASVGDAAEIPSLVAEMNRGLEPSLVLYLEAIQHGPPSIQLRAAFQIGSEYLALAVRARSSLADPRLDAELEPLLDHAFTTAWLSFTAVVRAAELDPAYAPDDVTRIMVRSARAYLAAHADPEGARLASARGTSPALAGGHGSR